MNRVPPTKPRSKLACLTLALTLTLPIIAGCGNADERRCRKIAKVYSIAYQAETSSGMQTTRSLSMDCSFDPAQVANRCEIRDKSTNPSTGAIREELSVSVTKWSSLSDFLDAGLPIGQLRTSSYTNTITVMDMDTPCVLGAAYTYDQQGRPLAVMGTGSPECVTPSRASYQGSSTFDAWDQSGRYTHGRTGFGKTLCEFNRTIDDATKTIVNVGVADGTPGCGAATTTSRYDANGTFLGSMMVGETQTSMQTGTVSEVEEICGS